MVEGGRFRGGSACTPWNIYSDSHPRVVTIPPAVFMWPLSSPQNPYRETIKAKHTWRADVLELALPFSAEEHQKYLSATGTVQLPSPS